MDVATANRCLVPALASGSRRGNSAGGARTIRVASSRVGGWGDHPVKLASVTNHAQHRRSLRLMEPSMRMRSPSRPGPHNCRVDFEEEAPTELGHYLYVYSRAEDGSVRWNKIRSLAASEHEAVRRALDLLSQLLRRKESVVDIAYRDLRDLTDRLTALFVDLDFTRRTEAWLPELRYRFAAVSTALRMYDEATTAEARRLGDSAAVENVRSLFRTAYDSSYAYRLVYALRNPLIHGAGEMIDSKVRSWLDSQEEKHAELTLSLRRDAFG